MIPLVIMGGKDELVPPRHGRWIAEAYKKAKAEHKLIVYPNSGHGLEGSGDRDAAVRESVEWFGKYLKKAG